MKKKEKKEKAGKGGKRKVWIIVIAVIVILGVAFGGGDEPEAATETPAPVVTEAPEQKEALPVQFGEITSVGPLGDNSEMIVMSLDEGISDENKERAVYVNAVDYLFTYASEDLAELSVFGFDAAGAEVLTVVFGSDLVTALRQIEADGDWGTEGIAAWFWFNADAYNILVESATVIE